MIVGLLGLLPPVGLLGQQPAGPATATTTRPGSAWLLLVPVLVVLLVQPTALGSYAVSGRSVVPGGGDDQYPPLAAPVRGAVPMSMAEFVTRAVRDPGQSLTGVRVRLVEFVAPSEDADGYRLTRFVIFCCAADAEALQAVVHDPAPGPGPVAGGRGNLAAPPDRRRRPDPTPAGAPGRPGAPSRPAPAPLRVLGPVHRPPQWPTWARERRHQAGAGQAGPVERSA